MSRGRCPGSQSPFEGVRKKSGPRGRTGQGGLEDLGVSRQERPGDHETHQRTNSVWRHGMAHHRVLDHPVDLSFVYEESKTSQVTLETPHGILYMEKYMERY